MYDSVTVKMYSAIWVIYYCENSARLKLRSSVALDVFVLYIFNTQKDIICRCEKYIFILHVYI